MISTKRWNDPVDPADGLRILVTRYRPRGLPKAKETWNLWIRDLAPSAELHAAFYGKHGPRIAWPEYRVRYCNEMCSAEAEINRLSQMVADGTAITLLCSSACVCPANCHRSLLRDLILQARAACIAA